MDYILNIERELGNWRKLPEYPFQGNLDFAVFSSPNDLLIDRSLYETIFDMNKALGNKKLILKAILDTIGKAPDLLVQKEKCWEGIDEFLGTNLVFEGFYITGDKLNWLGIYHPDNYFVLGAPKAWIDQVCNSVYGHSDWAGEFITQYEGNKLEIYYEDFKELKRNLLQLG